MSLSFDAKLSDTGRFGEEGVNMSAKHSTRGVDLSSNTIGRSRVSGPVGNANYEEELADIMQHVGVVSERELRVQIDCLIHRLSASRATAAQHFSGLTPRQRQIMPMMLAGQSSKNIAVDLGVSQRTVENHRAAIMKKTGSKSLVALARLALVAAGTAALDQIPDRRSGNYGESLNFASDQ